MSTERKMPADPAKGNLQGQTTLAAKIDRWTGFHTNLAPHLEEMPQFRDQILEFQSVLSQTQTLRDRMNFLRGEFEGAVQERDALFARGDGLYGRLVLALRAIHGPGSSRLHEFGVKPRKKAGGRPRKTPAPPADPATSEVSAAASEPGGTAVPESGT